MRTLFSHRLSKTTSLLVLSFGLAGIAKAGPGIDYWRRMDQMKIQKETSAATQPAEHSGVCTDHKTVAVTALQKDWSNGKGPSHFVAVGTKEVCQSCGGTTTVMQKSWPNAKGPLQPVQVPVAHTCGSCATTQNHS